MQKSQKLGLQDLRVTSFVTKSSVAIKAGSVLTDHSCPETEKYTCGSDCGGSGTTLPCTEVIGLY